jgi:hypothetical protein
VSPETEPAAAGDFVIDAHRLRGVKDHVRACALARAPFLEYNNIGNSPFHRACKHGLIQPRQTIWRGF